MDCPALLVPSTKNQNGSKRSQVHFLTALPTVSEPRSSVLPSDRLPSGDELAGLIASPMRRQQPGRQSIHQKFVIARP